MVEVVGLKDWYLYAAWIAVLSHEGVVDTGREGLGEIEERARHIIALEGGRTRECFWHFTFQDLDWDSGALRLVTLFEARGQWPIQQADGTVSLELFVREPEDDPGEIPLALGAEVMVKAIRDRLNGSGELLVVDIQAWTRASDLIPE